MYFVRRFSDLYVKNMVCHEYSVHHGFEADDVNGTLAKKSGSTRF
jgi:hypothetical protein